MQEPMKSREVLSSMAEVRDTAEQTGHQLGQWKWDGDDWYIGCENKDCCALAWVNPTGTIGGEIEKKCSWRNFEEITKQ